MGEGENVLVNEPANMKMVYNEDIVGEAKNQLPVKSDDLLVAEKFVLINDGSLNDFKIPLVNLIDGQWVEETVLLDKQLSKGENEFILEDFASIDGRKVYISIGNEVFGPVDLTKTYNIDEINSETFLKLVNNSADMQKGETAVVACWIPNYEDTLIKSVEVFGSDEYVKDLKILYDNPEKTYQAFERCSMICVTFE